MTHPTTTPHAYHRPVGDAEAGAAYLAACDGDRESVRGLVARFNGELMGVARAMGMTDHDAVDVVQLTWMRFFEHIDGVGRGVRPSLRDAELVRFWLLSTVRNAVRDTYRRRTRDRSLIDRKTADDDALGRLTTSGGHASEIIEEERLAALRAAVAALDESDRDLVALLIADPPLSYEQIAEILGRPVGSIGPTRARCLKRLRLILEGAGHG